jgi:CD81 antigen
MYLLYGQIYCLKSPIVLLQFFCFLLIIVVAEIAAGVWAYSNRYGLEKYVESSVRSTVQDEYGVVDTRTQTFDAIQKGVSVSFLLHIALVAATLI